MNRRFRTLGLFSVLFTLGSHPTWAGDIDSDIIRGQFTGDGGYFELGARALAGNSPIVGVPKNGDTAKAALISVSGRYQLGAGFVELDEIGGLNVGLNFFAGDNWWLDAVISQAHGAIDPEDINALRNSALREREADLPVGLRATGYLGSTLVQITVLSGDLRDNHNGQTVSAKVGRHWQQRKLNYHWLVGAVYDSDKVTHYYFGIDPNQSDANFMAYVADSSLRLFAELGLTLALTEKWVLRGKAQYTHLSDAIADSPIIEDDYASVAAVALNYVF